MATLVVHDGTSPVEDAEALMKACKGWGTDEKGVISILAHRNATQRTQIRQAFQETYHEDLITRLESELSGDFEKAMYRWILEPADRDAVLVHVALSVKKVLPKPNYDVIVEIACTRSPEDLLSVKRAYKLRYNNSIEEDVAAYTSGDIRKLLVGLVSAYRYEGNEINARLAHTEADVLQDAIEKKEFNHEEIIRILTTRSAAQLMATFNRFKDYHGSSIPKKLLADSAENEFLGLLRTAFRCLDDPKKYFQKVLRNAIKRAGTDEDALTRVIVTRAEKDLKEIKEVYYMRNSVILHDAVAKDTSGDYKNFLLTLIGE